MALFAPPHASFSSSKLQFPRAPTSFAAPRRLSRFLSVPRSVPYNGVEVSAAVVEDPNPQLKVPEFSGAVEDSGVSNGAATAAAAVAAAAEIGDVPKFEDPKWVAGTWDLNQFQKNGSTDWDSVIDAEARRRKLLESNPESSRNDDIVVFSTSVIPWWAWIKRYHLPEAELLNGRAAMVGFFMAYFVDSLTGAGLVDQMGNFFCKTLLFVAVLGVLLIRKNEDLENLKKLFEETTFYDKQWQASWQDDTSNGPKND